MPLSMADSCLLLHAAGAPQDINSPYATVRFCTLIIMAFPMQNILELFRVHLQTQNRGCTPMGDSADWACQDHFELHQHFSVAICSWSACIDLA